MTKKCTEHKAINRSILKYSVWGEIVSNYGGKSPGISNVWFLLESPWVSKRKSTFGVRHTTDWVGFRFVWCVGMGNEFLNAPFGKITPDSTKCHTTMIFRILRRNMTKAGNMTKSLPRSYFNNINWQYCLCHRMCKTACCQEPF